MATKQRPRMITGYNHNVKHKGRIFHVQTEDSGIDNPHIITHLFIGGNILASKKTSYADIVNAENLEDIVKELMQEQHKAMLRNLVNGVYDDIEIPGEAPSAPPPQAPPAPVPAAQPPVATPSAPPPQPPPVPRPPQPAPLQPRPISPPRPQPPAPPVPDQPPPATPAPKFPPARPAPRTEVSIPLHRLPTQPVIQAVPPSAATDVVPGRPAPPPSRITVQAKPPPLPQRSLPPEVLAARELTEKPKIQKAPGPTIFGEDLITEKSLDEVILSYLAGEEKEQ